jgi:lysozyme
MSLGLIRSLEVQLLRDEGKRPKPYFDCCGKFYRECRCPVKGHLTIGIGRNLDENGLTEDEISLCLKNDVEAAERTLSLFLPWTDLLDDVRRGVLVNMSFNMGINRLMTFKKMLGALQLHDWVEAAQELADSHYGRSSTRNRAARLAKQLVTGEWQ